MNPSPIRLLAGHDGIRKYPDGTVQPDIRIGGESYVSALWASLVRRTSLVSVHKRYDFGLSVESALLRKRAPTVSGRLWVAESKPTCHRRSRQCAKTALSKPAYSMCSPNTRSAAI